MGESGGADDGGRNDALSKVGTYDLKGYDCHQENKPGGEKGGGNAFSKQGGPEIKSSRVELPKACLANELGQVWGGRK